MRDRFPGYYDPAPEERDRILSDGIIVLDANVLLNLFRYSARTRDELLDLLREEQSRIWSPHQVALEFLRNRRAVPAEQAGAFDAVSTALADADGPIREAIDGLRRHPALEAETLTKRLDEHTRKLRRAVKRARKRYLADVAGPEAQLRTLEAVTVLYEDRVGPPYDEKSLKAHEEEAAKRFAAKVPPGYRDSDKNDSRRYGDYILWRQMLDHGAVEKTPMIFVTDDLKDDWWLKTGKYPEFAYHGPRPELIEEYLAASTQRIVFYQTRDFLSVAKARGASISESAVDEARSVSVRRRNDFIYTSWLQQEAMAGMDRVLRDADPQRLAKIRRLLADFDRHAPSGAEEDALRRFLNGSLTSYDAVTDTWFPGPRASMNPRTQREMADLDRIQKRLQEAYQDLLAEAEDQDDASFPADDEDDDPR